MFQFYRYLHAKHAIHRFDTKFLGWELYVHMYSNVHIQKHSSKKQIRFFFLYCLVNMYMFPQRVEDIAFFGAGVLNLLQAGPPQSWFIAVGAQ